MNQQSKRKIDSLVAIPKELVRLPGPKLFVRPTGTSSHHLYRKYSYYAFISKLIVEEEFAYDRKQVFYYLFKYYIKLFQRPVLISACVLH